MDRGIKILKPRQQVCAISICANAAALGETGFCLQAGLKAKKPATLRCKPPACEFLYGGRYWTRTSDPLRVRQNFIC